MNRTIIAAALSLSSIVAPLAAHAGSFHEGRGNQRIEFRQGNEGRRAEYREPLAMRRGNYGQQGWRMERAHEIRSGRMQFGHGRW